MHRGRKTPAGSGPAGRQTVNKYGPRRARLTSMERATGFEPADDGLGSHCLTTWRCPRLFEHSNTACLRRGAQAQFPRHKPQSTARCGGREERTHVASRHLLTIYAIPAQHDIRYLRKVICKTQASHLQAPFATLSIHAAHHRKVNHMVTRALRPPTEGTDTEGPTQHDSSNKRGRCLLRGGDPIRGGTPLAAGHAGLLGGGQLAL